VRRFDHDLKQVMQRRFADEVLRVPHRVFAVRAVCN